MKTARKSHLGEWMWQAWNVEAIFWQTLVWYNSVDLIDQDNWSNKLSLGEVLSSQNPAGLFASQIDTHFQQNIWDQCIKTQNSNLQWMSLKNVMNFSRGSSSIFFFWIYLQEFFCRFSQKILQKFLHEFQEMNF